MDSPEPISLLMRWLHVLSAATFAGGTFFIYFAVRGALQRELDAQAAERVREAMMKRWKHVIAGTFVLLVVSGLYNYLVVQGPLHQGQGLYHALFGVKFLAALIAFGVAFVVTSTMAWSERFRKIPALWHALVLITVALILIAGYMRLMPGQEAE